MKDLKKVDRLFKTVEKEGYVFIEDIDNDLLLDLVEGLSEGYGWKEIIKIDTNIISQVFQLAYARDILSPCELLNRHYWANFWYLDEQMPKYNYDEKGECKVHILADLVRR